VRRIHEEAEEGYMEKRLTGGRVRGQRLDLGCKTQKRERKKFFFFFFF
jgi:hypothetical protein